MRFRGKIFLAILAPACVLVAAAVAAALWGITWRSERDARSELGRTRDAVEHVFTQRREQLQKLGRQFKNPRFGAALSEALRTGNRDLLRQQVVSQIEVLAFSPDFYEVRGPAGELLLRQSSVHSTCGSGCEHPLPEWVVQRPDALAEIDGEPFAAVVVPLEEGAFIFGTHLALDLDKLVEDFEIGIVLLSAKRVLYTSVPAWTREKRKEGNVRLDGTRYLAESWPYSTLELVVLLRDMSDPDREKRITVAVGAAALLLAFLVAFRVSHVVSGGVSRPVETLVEATRRVGEGDFTARVDIPGRDELASLGRAFNDMTGGLRKRREIMEKTLSRDVAEELMRNVELGGDRREVTILFADVRDYTSATEGVDPALVVTTLNDMMHRLTDAIHRQGGNVNKYLGDGLMAMFGAPRPLEDHALCAVRAAVEMQRQMADWNAGRSAKGLKPLQIGVGINTGRVVGGNVGSRDRLEYTLIGEEVNLASRVCGKAMPGQVLVTKSTLAQAHDQVAVRELEPVQVKGLSYPIPIYEVRA